MCGPNWSCHLHFLLGPALFPWLYGLSQPLMAFCVQGEKREKRVVTTLLLGSRSRAKEAFCYSATIFYVPILLSL